MSSILAWAKWWQSLGVAVYPLPPLRKKPSVGGLGIRSATTDLAQIESWWTAQPDANIGIVGDSNATSRFLLRVDIDPKRAGDKAWRGLVYEHGCPDTLTIKTPSGGFHYYFITQQAYGNGTGSLPDGIDIRGHLSGYTVGAPSATMYVPGESVAGRYELEKNVGMADAPQWLLDMLSDQKRHDEPVEVITAIDDVTFNELRDALSSPGMLKDWARWSDNGLALRSLGNVGYRLWTEYSAAQLALFPDQVGTDTAETWWKRHPASGVKSDYRSIFSRAQGLGWKNPRSVDPSTLGFGQSPLPAQATTVAPVVTATTRKFQVLNEAQFTDGPDPEWRVEGLIPEVGLAMIYGPSGVGKSFFVLDLLAHISDGRDYGATRRKVKQGRTVYVMAEGAGGMRQRVRAYRHKYPANHNNFNIIAASPNLMTPADVSEICQAIMEAGGAEVIVFDTLHASMAGADENSAKDMSILLTNARTISACLKATVIFIHHSGKDETKGARGSSSIRAAMDTEIEIGQNPNDPTRRVASIAKQRDGDDNFSWEYTLEPVVILSDKPCASAVVKHTDRTSKSGDSSPRNRHAKAQGMVAEAVQGMVEQYPEGIQLEVLIAQINSQRVDLTPDNIRRSITKAIDRGEVSINSDSLIKLAWVD